MKDIFPKAVKPPKLVKSYAPVLGYVAASILAIVAIVHLFRIDTLVPIINDTLPGGARAAGTFVVVIVLAEVFALPFLLRIKLSPLAHIVSGFLAVFAPLLWMLLAIWSYGNDLSVGLFGEFVQTPSTLLLLFASAVWLSFNFYTLWTLGYNNLKVKDVLRK
jgi:predicted neutral ceramidase superfamily lipid hydrolase